MTPDQLREFEELKITVQKIQSVTDISFIEELKRRLISGNLVIETGLSPTNIAVRDATDTTTELVADDFDGAVGLYSNGVFIGRIGYWN